MPLLESTPARLTSTQIANALGLPAPAPCFDICGISTDTRSIVAGNCFLALTGEHFNGNRYAPSAVEQGAVLCILSEPPTAPLGVPYFLVEDTVAAYGAIARAYLRSLRANGTRVLAVTGSSGKTTVKDMTACVLARQFRTYCTSGNHNNHIGVPFTILHTPPEAEMLVLEMGMNHRGEIHRLTQIGEPDIGLITNIGTAHIGNLGSQEEIFRAKLELTDGMSPQTGRLLLPAEDAFLCKYDAIPFPRANVSYSTRCDAKIASLCAGAIEESSACIHFIVRHGAQEAQVHLPMTGMHNVTDALLAMHAGLECGMSLHACAEALSEFTPTALRSDRVQIGNLTVIRDFYNANPEAMRASLHALQLAADGKMRRIALLGNMNELGDFAPQAHRALGALCRTQTDAVFFCGRNASDFAAGYGDPTVAFETRDALIAALPQLFPCAAPACVLIKASRGMQMEHVFDALVQILQSQNHPTAFKVVSPMD